MLEVSRTDARASARCARPTASTSTCAEGETHAVIGPNGAGKTTFISQLAGNLRPDAGRIRFAGEDITTPARAAARAQGPGALVPDHQRLPRVQRAAERGARGAGALRPQLPLLARRARRSQRWSSRRERVLEEVGLAAPDRRPGGEPRARRAAPARGGDGARHAAAPAAARRADGRHGHRGIAAHDRAARRAQAAARPSSWSSTTWTRCSGSPTASRCWSTAASSPPTCRRGSANEEVRTAYLGEDV